MTHSRRLLRRILRERRGQAMAEYAVVVGIFVVATSWIYFEFPEVVMGYYREVIHIIALPLP